MTLTPRRQAAALAGRSSSSNDTTSAEGMP